MSDITKGPLTALAFCWRLERADGAGLALTSGDRALDAGGVRYRAAPGMTPASIKRSLGVSGAGGEVAGAMTADCLSAKDLALGRWDGASVSLTAVDWSDPSTSAVALLAGQLGEVAVADDGFSAELRGASSRLEEAPCPSTSPECRASFGDPRCRVDLARRTLRTTVESASGNSIKLVEPIDSRFLFGRLRYFSGANCGISTAILAVNGSDLSVRDRPAAAVEPGTVVEVREGCDKRFETCVSRFDNAVNFRGEPHLPGTDLLTRYPGI